MVETADGPARGVEFYIPHKAVIRESAETTKLRIVYDASARANPARAQQCKERAMEIFEDATFRLHKWNSNVKELEMNNDPPGDREEPTYGKQQFGGKPTETKMLGLKWNKEMDTLTVSFPHANNNSAITKRGILSTLAKIYDPLGLVSPVTLEGKLIYRDVCKIKVPWDTEIQGPCRRRWLAWEKTLPKEKTVPRPIVEHKEVVLSLELHAFGDASANGVGAVVYSVVRQNGGSTQRLVSVKARLAKEGLTIPRLELVSAHMAANLVTNVRNALQGLPELTIYGWLDSTVALHWLSGNGKYKQFVTNRVSKIKQHKEIKWRHVPTLDNPVDLASRGESLSETPLWWNGPGWLNNPCATVIRRIGSGSQVDPRGLVRSTHSERAQRLRSTVAEAQPSPHSTNRRVDCEIHAQL